jgi:NADH-quinone oxidoreductase subunit G
MITAKIDGKEVKVDQGISILDAALTLNIRIPTLCKHPDLCATAACGICVVKNLKTGRMVRACAAPLEEGMELLTHDAELQDVRKTVLELILSAHPNDCLKCGRNNNCELQRLSADFGIREIPFADKVKHIDSDTSSKAIELVPPKCILCGRCVQVCQQMQDVWALSFVERGFDTRIATAGEVQLNESPCVQCGQCSAHCPTGAIFEHDQSAEVWKALHDPERIAVVQIAPAVRVAIGEAFGYKPGVNLTKKLYTALRMMGFKAVFDTNFSADLTIMEEGAEFVKRVTTGGVLPMITTCCPAWVDFMEKYENDMIPNFSTAKSPQQMMGAMVKTYYAEKQGVPSSKYMVISVMPCTAKKFEVQRSKDMASTGCQDVDIAITTRELARMIKQAGIDFETLPESEPDQILAEYTGAGTIFGATGGVMEAALRTGYNMVTGKELGKVEFLPARGLEGIKEGEVDLNGVKIRYVVAHGLGHVEAVLKKVRDARDNGKELPWHFIEVMACPGGCVGGGGQPYGATNELRLARAKGLYDEDTGMKVRCSHHNTMVKKAYDEYLGKPLSDKSHHLLHTHYEKRKAYKR